MFNKKELEGITDNVVKISSKVDAVSKDLSETKEELTKQSEQNEHKISEILAKFNELQEKNNFISSDFQNSVKRLDNNNDDLKNRIESFRLLQDWMKKKKR